MKNLYGIDPETEHYSCILDLLGRAGMLDDMVKLIQEMNCEPKNTLVGLVTFDSMVYVHDLGYSECSKVPIPWRL
ncbi:hypothetical protein AHAS_Ahas11G0133300 [Arachis hypogaea]